ncbi:S9 family peptidase [Endozoicomonas sp. 4G]|uniref:S9 family peptidase n=1 Tax=Endozoicomonas sp. 4G TaxID=2872754 RepID=UPI002078A59E|nr:S9 family peptidase [Endozoicomonas sp. 4G]
MKKLGAIALLISVSLSANAVVTKRTANNGNLVMEDVPVIPQQIIDDVRRYQKVSSAPFREFSQSGESIFISTHSGGVRQLHRVDTAGGARKQLTFFKEPIGSINRQPDSDNISFSMDDGGDGYTQLFLLNTATGESKMLSDGESRNSSLVWSKDGAKFAYRSTRRNGKSNDIWMMNPTAPESAEIVLKSTDGSLWRPLDWSDDNKKLLAQRYISSYDSRIYLVDLATKQKVMLAGNPEKTSVNYGLGFDADNQGMFFLTNEFSDFNQLAYQPFGDGEVKVITSNINWNVNEFEMSQDGKRAAFVVNQDGVEVMYLLDPESHQFVKVKGLPIGLVSGLEFSDDGSKIGLTLNTAQTPSDSFVLGLGEKPLQQGRLTRWTFSKVGPLDTSKFSLPELVRVKSFDDREIPAFVYKPDTKGKKPVIISIHGGPASQFRPSFRKTFQLWMDQLDAAVIAPNVRGSTGYGKEYLNLDNGFRREDSVKDIGALLDWIKTQPDLDENRVALIGGSYGGYMVLASAVHYSDRLKAAVDRVGISNFVTFLENTKSYRRDLRRMEYGDERDPQMRAHLEKISPNNNVDKINIPMFVVQGQNDPRVPVTEAEQIVKSLRDHGKEVWYMNALNEGHGYSKKENRDIYTQAVVMFFEEFL